MSRPEAVPASPRAGRRRTSLGTGPERRAERVRADMQDGEDAAAVIAVFAALWDASTSSGAADADTTRSYWADPSIRMGSPLAPGPGSWWASGLAR